MATSRASGSPRTVPARRTSCACAPSRPTRRSSTLAASCARTWTGSSPPSRPVLAYLSWHRAAAGIEQTAYEQALERFHRSLAHRPPRGYRGSAALRVPELPWLEAVAGAEQAPGYEDWYLIDDWSAV